MTTTTKRCEGKRRKQRGSVFGTFACGRKATTLVTTKVGMSRSRYVCDDAACFNHVTSGYPASSRKL